MDLGTGGGRTAGGFQQATGLGRKPPQASGKVRSQGANGRSVGAGQRDSERAAAGIGPAQAAGEGDPGSCQLEQELDNPGHDSVIGSAAGRALEGRGLW